MRKWLKDNAEDAGASCIRAALDLNKALEAKDSPDFSFYVREDDVESIGAMCFIAWDDPDLVWDACGHEEEMAYNSSEVVEAYARKTYPLSGGITDQQLAELVKDTMGYLNRWHLLEKLVSHFPSARCDDET